MFIFSADMLAVADVAVPPFYKLSTDVIAETLCTEGVCIIV